MKNNRRTIINMVCSISVLLTNVIISLFLSPYIVDHIGVEANGFITLANNFVTYGNLIVLALNSMAARYITIAYVQKDYKTANLYYNSVFWGNLIIVAVFLLPAAYLIAQLQNLFDIPANIVWDVKLLFSFVFFNFFLTTGAPNWDSGTYATNRLDLRYIPNMITALLRCAALFLMMTVFVPHVWYVGFMSTVVVVINLAVNGYNTHRLTPELRIKLKKGERLHSRAAVKELVGSGIWYSISDVGNMLLSGLDLIICNLAIGATAMGVLSLSKVLPNYMQQFSSAIRSAFAPELTINYALDDKEAISHIIKRSMKLTSIILTIPVAVIVVLGDKFFALWVPTQDAALLQTLSILAIVGFVFTSGTQILYNVFPTVDKVKLNGIAMLVSGAVSTTLTLLVIHFTDLDIYAVAGVSTIVSLIRNMSFTLPVTARLLGYKWYQFYPQVAISAASSAVLILLGLLLKQFFPMNTWAEFILAILILCFVGLGINISIVLNKEERTYLFAKIRQKLKKAD